MRLVFEDLARAYQEVLQAKLRNFSVGPDFLQTWVHEEDAARSLYGIFEAAAAAKLAEPLTVFASAATAAALDRAAFERELGALGELTAAAAPDGFEWTVAFTASGPAARSSGPRAKTTEADPRAAALDPRGADRFAGRALPVGTLEAVGPAYRAAVEKAAATPRFEGALAAPAGTTLHDAEQSGAALTVAVDAAGTVAAARHRNAAPAYKGILDELCAVLPGRTLQEGADHGLIRVEDRLRDRAKAKPVAGILTPDNADPAFRLPQRLIREVFRDWAKAAGWKAAPNTFDDAPRPAWLAFSEAEKLERLRPALQDACRALGLQDDVEAVAVLNDVRVVLAFVQDAAKPPVGARLIELERRLKAALEPRLELQLEGLSDRNARIQRTARDGGKIR
ncbi:MAG: hypothetical protein HYZ75_07080 [Elusimicrobia bacterium]|nr:hypothetical protein [Elusimicrobiota bacterium]